MKKFLTLLCALCIALGCMAFVACSNSSGSTEVTAQEYASALEFNGDLKLVMQVIDGSEEITTTFVRDDNKIEMKNVQAGEVNHIYLNKANAEYFIYAQVNGQWIKQSSNEEQYNYYKDFPLTATRAYNGLAFQLFTYDTNENCYVFTQTGEGMSGTFKMYFNDKKVVKIQTTVVHHSDGATITTKIDFTYGEKVTLPLGDGNEGGSNQKFVLTADNYNALMTISDLDCVAHGTMTGEVSGVYDTIYNENKVLQKEYDGQVVTREVYIVKEGDVYFQIRYDPQSETSHMEPIAENTYIGMRLSNNLNFVFDFADWTYNEALDRYECDEKSVGEGEIMLNAWFKVENGKLASYGLTDCYLEANNGEDAIINYNFVIEYTKIDIVLPEVK